MYQTTLSPEEAVGHILRHNIASADGHKALPKGRRLTAEHTALLRELGVEQVPVAVLEPGDVHEDEAARRVAQAITGAGLNASTPAASRVNVLAASQSVFRVDQAGLLRMNSIEGITVATRPTNSLASASQRVATIKIIPFAVPQHALDEVEQIHRDHGPLLQACPLQPLAVGVIMVSSASARERIAAGVFPAIAGRVTNLGAYVRETLYVAPEEHEVATAISHMLDTSDLLIIAGETSIMDGDDVTPRGIRLVGGSIEHYGAPVEPGNLLLMAYARHGSVPILGAPGCVRSRDTNIVDLLLPRLLAGEHITRADIVQLGHGGLL